MYINKRGKEYARERDYDSVIEATLEHLKNGDRRKEYEDLLKSYKKGDLKATFDLALMINECCLWGYDY